MRDYKCKMRCDLTICTCMYDRAEIHTAHAKVHVHVHTCTSVHVYTPTWFAQICMCKSVYTSSVPAFSHAYGAYMYTFTRLWGIHVHIHTPMGHTCTHSHAYGAYMYTFTRLWGIHVHIHTPMGHTCTKICAHK